MSTAEKEVISELNVYSGLDSFNSSVVEKELELCEKFGADVNKLRALKFNALQLAEIRKGYESEKVDVNKYLNPKLSWTEMEELRLEMEQGIDMSKYRQEGFDNLQLYQIRAGLADDIDVSIYARKEYLADQMREIRKGLSKADGVPIIFYQDPAFDPLQMREIRKGLQAGIDISSYATLDVPYMKMRAVRKSAEDGLYFEISDIKRYSASVLEEMHQAYNEQIDINSYVKKRYDGLQLEQIRLGLKANLPMDKYISWEMCGDSIKEIRLGLEAGLDVSKYANSSFGWAQMSEIRTGLDHQIDVTPYCKPLYRADQMREIRLGIEEGVDISRFSSMMYTAKDMKRIREKLLTGELRAVSSDDGKAVPESTVPGRTIETVPNETALLANMLENRDVYLSVSEDKMKCYITLPLRKDGLNYTEEIILTFLFKCKICKGINKEAVKSMLKRPEPDLKYLVAQGKDVIEGHDGYYEYFFDTEHKNEFKYLSDGSVDFSNIDFIQQVHVGDKLAVYHKAAKGVDGYNVYGEPVPSKGGREIPVLKGDGFMIMSDRITYVAKISGAVSMDEGQINVKKVMILPEVKITDKKINYNGVVYVLGDVNSGSEIKATGDIVIGGHMESSVIESNGNVIIAGGATCPVRGSIIADGDVAAKFFEGVSIKGRAISANYFINCDIEAKTTVKTFGRQGMLYGGTCQCLDGVETAIVGNKTGVKTVINIGGGPDLLTEYANIQKELSREEDKLKTLITERDRLAELGSGDLKLMQWKIKINAAVGTKEQEVKKIQARKAAIERDMKKASRAQVVITEMAYAGTLIVIDGVAYKLSDDRKTYDRMIFKLDPTKEHIMMV